MPSRSMRSAPRDGLLKLQTPSQLRVIKFISSTASNGGRSIVRASASCRAYATARHIHKIRGKPNGFRYFRHAAEYPPPLPFHIVNEAAAAVRICVCVVHSGFRLTANILRCVGGGLVTGVALLAISHSLSFARPPMLFRLRV